MVEALKDTGIEWVGQIPQTWKVNRVKDLFWRRKEVNRLPDPVVLSLARSGVKVRDISTNEGQLAASYDNYHRVHINDLMINPMDLISGANCSISYVEGVISPAYINLVAKKNVYPRYYDYYFKTQYWAKAMFVHGFGVSFDNRWTMNNETLMKYYCPVPTYSEQKKIADFLDEKCAEIDKLIANIQHQIRILEEYRHSSIVRAVTKGVKNHTAFKKADIDWVKEVPSEWQIMPNKYVMQKVKNIEKIYHGQNILSLTMNGVIIRDLDAGGKMPSTFNGYQSLTPGNLLMCLFDYDVTPRCIGIIHDHGVTSPAYSQFKMLNNNSARYFYYYYLMIDYTKELLHLAKNLRHSFTEDQLGSINVPVPPEDEQDDIADFLDSVCSKVDNAKKSKESEIEKLMEYKKSLIYEYVTGKKRA